MWEYEGIFDQLAGQEFIPTLWKTEPTKIQPGKMGYRTRTTVAGKRKEIDVYPIFGREDAHKARAAKKNITPEKMRILNEKRAVHYLTLLAEANFGERDYHLTLTYNGDAPGYEQAQKDVRNFLNRIKRRRKKLGLDELKYIYTIEGDENRRCHVHMLINGGIEREELESIWQKGYANADRLQPDNMGIEAVTRYLVKQQKNRRRWAASKNLKKPKVRVSDTKVSNAKVKRIAVGFEPVAKEVLEKLYKGYTLSRVEVYYSDFVDGIYIHAVMRKTE